MILRFILFALGFYILFKVVFDVIVPIFRVTQRVRRQFNDISEHMQGKADSQPAGYSPRQHPPAPSRPAQEPNKAKSGDYIDFEEVK